MTKIRYRNILVVGVLLAFLIVICLYAPFIAQSWRASLYAHRSGSPELQTIVEKSDFGLDDAIRATRDNAVFPYESISLETGPCFGPCPIYVFTVHSDGHATLVTDHLLQKERRTYKSEVSPVLFARLTQLVFLAKTASHETHYAGDWTDDSEAVVRAQGAGLSWSVSDYGQVSPPEVWALIEVLRRLREQIDWQPTPPQASNSLMPSPLGGSA